MTLKDIIHRELKAWAPEFVQHRLDSARKHNLATTNELLGSMRTSVTAALDEVQSMFFAMEQHGRILDMRRVKQRSGAPLSELIEWIKAIGPSKFKAGYIKRHGTAPKSQQQFINAVAWGIRKKQQAPGRRRKRRNWYNKDKETDIVILYKRLLDSLAIFSLSTLKKASK